MSGTVCYKYKSETVLGPQRVLYSNEGVYNTVNQWCGWGKVFWSGSPRDWEWSHRRVDLHNLPRSSSSIDFKYFTQSKNKKRKVEEGKMLAQSLEVNIELASACLCTCTKGMGSRGKLAWVSFTKYSRVSTLQILNC